MHLRRIIFVLAAVMVLFVVQSQGSFSVARADIPESKTNPDLSDEDRELLEKEYKYRSEKLKKEYAGVPWTQKKVYESEHYRIYCNSTKELGEYYSDLMETLYKKFSKVFAAFKPDQKKSEINIHRNHAEFMQVNRIGNPGVGGFYSPRTRQLVTYHGTFGASGDTSLILAHEGCHQFQHLIIKGDQRTFMNVPIWLLEGMAVIFEASDIDVEDKDVDLDGVNNDRLTSMQDMIEKDKYTPLMQIINCPKSKFRAPEYAHAGLLQYYMLFGKKRLRRVYDKYLNLAIECARKGTPVTGDQFHELLKKWARWNMEKLEEEWKEYVMDLKPESFGRTKGSTFECDKYRFQFKVPDRSWDAEYRKGLKPGEVCHMQIGRDEKTRVGVMAFRGGEKSLKEQVEESRKNRDDPRTKQRRQQLYQVYEREKERFFKLKGYDAYEVILKIQQESSSVNKGLQKLHYVTIEAYGYMYRFTMQVPYEDYDKHKAHFEEMVQSFTPYVSRSLEKAIKDMDD